MANIFSASEVVELGIQIEKNGRDFYAALSSKSKNKIAARAFEFLAGEEEKHIQVFKGILDETNKYEPQAVYADEYFAYMNALAGDYVFTKENTGRYLAQKITSDKEAVETGIGFEKDSIVFYQGIKKAVPEKEQPVVDKLTAEEEKHLKKLLDLRKEIS